MNIIKFLKDKGITSTIRYSGTTNSEAEFEVRKIVKKKDIINSYLKKNKAPNNNDRWIYWLSLFKVQNSIWRNYTTC